jgi:transposase
MDAGYCLKLVNTAKARQYDGLKHTDDRHDAFWLAHQMRLGIPPAAYIYPKAERAVRDLLRVRRRLVRQRVERSEPSLSLRLSVRRLSIAVRSQRI